MNIAQSQEQHKLVENEKASALLKIQELESLLSQFFKHDYNSYCLFSETTKDQRDQIDKKFQDTLESISLNKKKLQEAADLAKESRKKLEAASDIIASQLDSSS